jgi:hypothetical protein
MPTFIHECPVAWFVDEKCRMFATGFLTAAELPVLNFGGSPSEYFFSFLLLNFSTKL